MNLSLDFYRRFSRLSWPKSYLGKFLLIAFLGVHLPLIALIGYVALRQTTSWNAALPVLVVALVATLIGTGATLVTQSWLLAPLLRTARALEEYRRTRKMLELPTEYTDDAGILMANAQNCVAHLEALLNMKRDLLAVISHDTRNPMGQITTASQLIDMMLEGPNVDAKQIKRLNGLIQGAGQRQLKLMDNLMTLARSEREAIAINQDEVAVADLLESTADNARLQAERKSVKIQVEDTTFDSAASQRVPVRVLLDNAKTGQVLNNLLHNALKFTPEGGTVTLAAARATDKRGESQLVVTVQDTGIGMDEAIRGALFTPFTKAGRVGTAGEASSGLGLWICKTFTEAQGGEIEVRSEVGNGSQFIVRLPWQDAPVALKENTKEMNRGWQEESLLAASGALAGAH